MGWKHRLTVNGTAGTWLQVVWHTVLITVMTALLRPEWLPENAWSRAFFPVSNKEYWYVTAFFLMLLFVPLMQFILKRIRRSSCGSGSGAFSSCIPSWRRTIGKPTA